MIKKDYISSKERLKFPYISDAGLFWIIYLVLIIGVVVAWIR